jgi:hypothetical protein
MKRGLNFLVIKWSGHFLHRSRPTSVAHLLPHGILPSRLARWARKKIRGLQIHAWISIHSSCDFSYFLCVYIYEIYANRYITYQAFAPPSGFPSGLDLPSTVCNVDLPMSMPSMVLVFTTMHPKNAVASGPTERPQVEQKQC